MAFGNGVPTTMEPRSAFPLRPCRRGERLKKSKKVVVPVPGSKSDAIRALVVGALARGTTRITGAPASDDVRAAVRALRELGVRIEGRPGRGEIRVHGIAGRLPVPALELPLALAPVVGFAAGDPAHQVLPFHARHVSRALE